MNVHHCKDIWLLLEAGGETVLDNWNAEDENRMLFYAAAFISDVVSATIVQRTVWMWECSPDWWERSVMGTFTDEDWVSNLRMRRQTLDEDSSQCYPEETCTCAYPYSWYLETSFISAHIDAVYGLKTQLHLHQCSVWLLCNPDHLWRWFGQSAHSSQGLLGAFTPVLSCGQALSDCNLIAQSTF